MPSAPVRLVLLLVLVSLVGCRRSPTAPRAEPMSGPNWIDVTDREAPVAKPPTSTATAEGRSLEVLLAKKRVRGLAWDGVSLDAALTYLRTISGVDFKISEKVRQEKFEDVVISAQLDNVSLKTVLDVVLTAPFEMHWIVKDGGVLIRTNEEIDGPVHVRFYDVKDLVSYKEPKGDPSGKPMKAPPQTTPEMERLVEALRRAVAPGYWSRENAHVEARVGVLIVRAAKPILQQVDSYLTRQRAAMKAPLIPAKLLAELNATTVSMTLANTTVADALKTLQILTGRNIMIDPRIAAEAGKQLIVQMKLEDASVMTALTMLQSAAGEGLVWQARGSVLVLTHRKHLMGK